MVALLLSMKVYRSLSRRKSDTIFPLAFTGSPRQSQPMRYGPPKDMRTLFLLGAFFFMLGGGCTDDDPPATEDNGELEDTVEPYELMAADVLFKDINVPSFDVPLVPQCGSDDECPNDENCRNGSVTRPCWNVSRST